MANSKEIEDLFKVLNKKLNALRLEIDESIVDNIFESVVAIEQFKAQQNENIENHALKTDAHLSIEQKPVVELVEIDPPIGDFILEQSDVNPMRTIHGNYYHYSDVCGLLNKLKKSLTKSAMQQKTVDGLPKLDGPLITEEDFQEYFKSEANPVITDEEIEALAIDSFPIYPIRPTPLDWVEYVDLQRAIFINGFKAALNQK